MGGSHSSTQKWVEGIPSGEITFKEGDRGKPDPLRTKTDPSYAFVPYPLQANINFRSIFSSNEFKTFVFENLDCNALVTSILQNIEQESLLLDGISYHQSLNRNHKKKLYSQINQFQSLPLAGIHVRTNILYDLYYIFIRSSHFYILLAYVLG